MIPGLSPELLDAGKAIGLLDTSGDLVPGWFGDPVSSLRQILSNADQRAALLDLVDVLFPPATIASAPADEKWHPLLGDQSGGGFYFTVRDTAGHITLGAAGDIGREPGATLRLKLPAVSLNGGISAVAGTADGPLNVELRVPMPAGGAVPLAAVRVTGLLTLLPAPAEGLQVVLEGLDLDGKGPRDTALDPAHLDLPALQLVLGLVRRKLGDLLAAGGATDEAKAIAEHLLPLLGIGGSLPQFPFEGIAQGPAALQGWLLSLVESGGIADWLGHLAGLLGAANPVASVPAAGGSAPAWSVRILDLDGTGSGIDLTLTDDSTAPPARALKIGLSASFLPAGGAARIAAGATLVAIPLAGTAAAAVLPDASLLMIAPGGAGQLVAGSVGSLRAGARWTGTDLVPQLELLDVTVLGAHYDKIDLTSADSVVAAAKSAVASAITAALGATGTGAHFAALAGLVPPAGDAGSPHQTDLAALASNPAAAIGAFHRSVLLDAAHNWSFLLDEMAGLLGAGGAAGGAGTLEDPWRLAIASSGPVEVQLAAWNAQGSGNPADPQRLRIGLRAAAAVAPWQSTWTAELLAFDLPATGTGTVSLMAGQHARFSLQPVPAAPALAGLSATADTVGLAMDWTPGQAMSARATITNLQVAVAGSTVAVPSLTFPSPAGFDINNPGTAFGISTADFNRLLRGLLARGLSDWAGVPGATVAALLGLGPVVPGLPVDFPVLDGAFLADPLAALRAWLGELTGLSAAGTPFLPAALAWVQPLLANGLPASLNAPPPPAVSGAGTYDAPWSMSAAPRLELLAWLEPAGPPAAWNAALAARIAAATSFTQLVQRAAVLTPEGTDLPALAAALDRLAADFRSGDGVVPLDSQVPAAPGWTAGTPLACAHPLEPQDPSAIAQIRAQLDAWNPASRAVLLLGPAFSDPTIWDPLLAPATGTPVFDLRVAGADPLALDLTGVTAAVDYYTADLRDDGGNDLDNLAAQIGRVVERIRALRGGLAVTLVAHSTAGVAARAFTAANPTRVRGLITLGTPHAGAAIPALTDPDVGTALRRVQALAAPLAAGPIEDAVAHLLAAMDGFRPAAGAGLLPVAAPYPLGSFAGGASVDTAGVPALAIGSVLSGDPFAAIRDAAVAATTGTAAAAPTHLSFGLRTTLASGQATVRADAFRVGLAAAAPEPARPERALTVLIDLTQPGGWLVGSATGDVRIRRAELGAYMVPGKVTPIVRLEQAAFHGPAAAGRIDFGAPEIQPLLGALLEQVTLPADLLAALTTLGIAVTSPRVGLSADAFSALSADALAYLGPRVRAAVSAAGGVLGLPGPIPGIPGCEVYVTATAVGVRAAAMPLGPGATLGFDARLALADFHPELDLALTLGAATLSWSQAAGTLTLAVPPFLQPLTLVPAPAPAALAAVLEAAVPRLLLASGLSALLAAAAGPRVRVGALDALLADPGAALATALDGPHLTQLLQAVSGALGNPPGPGLALPGGLQITASGTNPLLIQLATTAPLGGALSLTLGASVDALRHVSPSGTLSLHVTLPGSWGGVTLAFGAGGAGEMLGVTLDVTPDGAAAIRLLPAFSGLGALAGAAAALLPAALDEVAGAVPASTIRTAALDVAQAFDLYDTAGGFAAHAAAWKALSFRTLTASAQAAAASAVAALLQNALPAGAVTASGTTVTLAVAPFSASAGWDAAGPSLTVKTTALKLTTGGVTADVAAGYAAGSIVLSAALGLNLQSSLGLGVVPQLRLDVAGGRVALQFLPLGAGTDSILALRLAPTPGVLVAGDALAQLARTWLLPIAADLLISAEKANFAKALWAGGPTVQSILATAGIVDGAGALAVPLPGVQEMIFKALQALAAVPASLKAGDLSVGPYRNPDGFGLALQGTIGIGGGGFKIVFGDTDFPFPPIGLSLQLFDTANAFKPSLGLNGIGVEFAGDGDSALINTSVFRLGSATGYLFATAALYPSLDLSSFGGGIKLGQLGLPLGQLGGGSNDSNPVAASLLSSDGGANTGDTHPVNPGIDVIAWVRDGAFDILFAGSRDPIWIGVHSSFGPIYIDKVGVAIVDALGGKGADLLVDGSVKLAGFQVEADELGLTIPFHSLLEPRDWSLDLAGLALSFEGAGISIAGGMLKNSGPNGVEYDGVLTVDLAGRGFSIVGGYARPNDALGGYTSLFLFVSLPIPLGGPPFFFVTGLGGGGGYNRELKPPADLSALPSFPLVAAIDDDSLANDPMSALSKMATQIPSRRGSYWLAAGVRFNSFVVVNTVAVVYVALDRGFEIAILGVSRMQLPAPGLAIASVELALKARFSTAEGVLSVQAQLTDKSYLFSPDCQLTGGFAFFLWFATGKFVLTLGGYHPAFTKPPEFPDVPRLGFNWSVSDAIVIKGGAYFALTSSAVMAGGSLDASASISGIRAWFLAYADLLICWDPFHYDVQIGVQVGISVRIHVCFFGCVTIQLTLSRGASVHIIGPPLHGEVTVDAYVTSITIPFGPDPSAKPSYLGWEAFAAKYLISGDPNNTCVGLRITDGLLPPEPPGAQPTAGSVNDPWKLRPEFAFSMETRMPASGYTLDLGAGASEEADQHLYDLAPMHQIRVGSELRITLTPAVAHPAQFQVQPIFANLPESTWRWSDPDHQAAAANLLRAMTGLSVTAVAILLGKSALIPISTLVDDDVKFAKPLPFAAVPGVTASLKGFGLTAETLAAAVATASTARTLTGAAALLSGAGVFADARLSVGTAAAGLSPVAAGALRSARSAPPLLAPITTGLSMKPVGLAAPPQIFRVPAISPVVLAAPRLHSVLQSLPQAVSDVPPPARTTVAGVLAAKGAPRMSAPRLQVVPGARLERVAPPTAPRPTKAALAGRSLRNPELAALTGTAHAQAFAAAAKLALGDGVTLPAGTTHLWELPGTGVATVSCAPGAGTAALRVTAFNRGLQVIDDRELAAAKTATVQLPAGATAVAVTCLGRSGSEVAAGFGAASFAAAPPGGVPAVGWQAGSLVAQVGPNTLLARGAVIALPVANRLRRNGQSTSYAMTRVAAAVASQPGVETWLPTAAQVLLVLLDQQDPGAALDGDLGIAVRGGRLAGPPVVVAGGTRTALLYDIIPGVGSDVNVDETISGNPAAYLAVAVGSRAGWRLSGVVGLRGSAVEQAVRMHGGVPPQIVPDGPLTADGESRVSLRIEAP